MRVSWTLVSSAPIPRGGALPTRERFLSPSLGHDSLMPVFGGEGFVVVVVAVVEVLDVVVVGVICTGGTWTWIGPLNQPHKMETITFTGDFLELGRKCLSRAPEYCSSRFL